MQSIIVKNNSILLRLKKGGAPKDCRNPKKEDI